DRNGTDGKIPVSNVRGSHPTPLFEYAIIANRNEVRTVHLQTLDDRVAPNTGPERAEKDAGQRCAGNVYTRSDVEESLDEPPSQEVSAPNWILTRLDAT